LFQFLIRCGELTLAGHQVPTKAALSLPCSAGQGKEDITKGSWVKRRTARDHSAITIMGKTDSMWGNWFNLSPVTSE